MSETPPDEPVVEPVIVDSILDTIKKKLGIEYDYHAFDTDVIIDINSAFMVLNQLGIGPVEGFSISDNTAIWSDFLGDNKKLEAVKSYMYLKVKLIFDPPTNSTTLESTSRVITEFESRLVSQVEDVLP